MIVKTSPCCLALLLIMLLLLAAESRGGENDAFQHMPAIAGTKNHDLHSEITGYDYHVLVRVPESYDASKPRRYPVVYLLDGGALFPMLAGYYKYLRLQESVPELIIVGISYGTDDWREGNHRGTDYTAPTDQREHWGGAGSFQRALQNEIIPLIEGSYRADSQKRIIFGQSLGGQFVLFTALSKPNLFWGHISSNPALHRNLELFLQPQANDERSQSHLFVARGSEDEAVYRVPGKEWMEHWNATPDKPWRFKATVIDGYGHFSIAPESFRRGLVWLFD